MPLEVLEKARDELVSYGDSGMSVLEMTHRGKDFAEIFHTAKSLFREALSVPDNYEILFLQGGASLQFASIPMNLIRGNSADYAVTGAFSGKAAREAEKYGKVNIACDISSTGFDRIPAQDGLRLSGDAEYFYYCANNTIYGTEWHSRFEIDTCMRHVVGYPVTAGGGFTLWSDIRRCPKKYRTRGTDSRSNRQSTCRQTSGYHA